MLIILVVFSTEDDFIFFLPFQGSSQVRRQRRQVPHSSIPGLGNADQRVGPTRERRSRRDPDRMCNRIFMRKPEHSQAV
jgi:hypothetical protein